MSAIRPTALIVAAFALSACSHPGAEPSASSGESTLEQRFHRLDANRDGFITWAEAAPARESDFTNMDRDKNGAVEPHEFRGSLPFGAFDENSDGAISRSEFLAKHRAMFMKFDENGDQRISPSEFATAQRAAGNVK